MISFYALVFAYFSLRVCVQALRCEIGEALKDPNNPVIDRTCSEGQPQSCPTGYECTARSNGPSVCCPSKAVECSATREVGVSCGRTVPVQRYYHDPATTNCIIFTYNGCFGNNNNFRTQEECERMCIAALCPVGTPARPGWSSGTAMIGQQGGIQQCTVGQIGQVGQISQVGQMGANQCPVNHECHPRNIGNQLGVCCPSAGYVCSLPSQPGSACTVGSQATVRYYFDSNSRACQMFYYLGCYGNDNNFVTVLECQQYCLNRLSSRLCPTGTNPAPGVTEATPCIGQYSQCPFGYTCLYSVSLGRSYCCSTSTTGQVCPVGSFPVLGNTQCVPSNPDQCPIGSACTINQQGQWHCCSTSSPVIRNVCPSGSTPQTGSTECSQTMPCQPNYVCEYTKQTGSTQCCSNRDPYGQYCPSGTNPSPDYRSCTQFSTNCPHGYTCQSSPRTGQTYCCTSPFQQVTQLCPPGTNPPPGTLSTTTCPPYGNTCSPGYTCQQSPYNRLWYCCSSSASSPITIQLCPHGWTASPDVNVNVPCTPYTTCTPGYSCQQSPSNGQSYCCRITGTDGSSGTLLCPVGSSPAPGVTVRNPCVAGQPCMNGFTCQPSPTNGYSYCCSQTRQETATCPQGGTPLIQPGTNSPVTCSQTKPCLYDQYQCQYPSGSVIGICCHGTSPAAGQECPTGFIPHRPAGQLVYCNYGGGPQQAVCQPYAQCTISPSLGTYICCVLTYNQRMLTVAAHLLTCEKDEDCSSIAGAVCTEQQCKCSDGNTISEEGCIETVTSNSTGFE